MNKEKFDNDTHMEGKTDDLINEKGTKMIGTDNAYLCNIYKQDLNNKIMAVRLPIAAKL